MKKSTLYLTLVALFVSSCFTNHSSKKPFTTVKAKPTFPLRHQEVSFKDFLNELPNRDLPLYLKCGLDGSIHDLNFNEKFKQFIKPSFKAAGKIETKDDYVIVLYTRMSEIPYPYMHLYKADGEPLDSIYLHIWNCGADADGARMTYTTIDKNLSIYMTDTAQYFNYQEHDSGYTRDLDSTIVINRTIVITDSLRFKAIKGERIKI